MHRVRQYAVAATVLALVLVAVFVWLARSRWDREQHQRTVEARSEIGLAMKWVFAGTMAPYFAARDSNRIFEDLQLAVELRQGGPGHPTSVQQVLLGDAQFGITGAHELALARAEDQPVISVAVIFKNSPVCLISFEEVGILKPADLRGKTVEMTTGDNAEFEYLAMLQKAGIGPEEVNKVPWPFHYQGLFQQQSHAAVVYENDQAITLANDAEELHKKTQLLCPRKFGVTPYADVLFTTESLVEENPDLVRRVVESMLQSWEWAARNVEATVDSFLSAPEIAPLDLDRATQMAILKRSLQFVRGSEAADIDEHIPKIGWQELERWEETIELLDKFGTAEKVPAAADCFSNRWVGLHEMGSQDDEGTGGSAE